MKKSDAFLKNHIIFWSRLGFGFDPPFLNEKGQPVLFNESLSELKYHKSLYEKGIKIHSFIVNSGWIGVNQYDYTVTDRVMDAAASIGEDVLLIPRVKLNPPIDWCKENPEELFVYHGGPSDQSEIRAIVGTEKHDILGYEAPNGYYMGDPKYNRPNVGGTVSRQSFSSEVWLADAKKALEKFVLHVEEKYPGKILGYHVAYGTSGETILWGRASHRYGDYGISHTKKFKAYQKEKLGTELDLPSDAERYLNKKTLRDFLRIDNEVSVCYDEFTSKVNARATEELCKVVKKAAPNALAGVFYGYLMVHNAVYTGHTEIDSLLSSPYVDFFAAPKSYYRCGPGDAGGEIGLAQSINLKKLWMDECDVRTHLAKSDLSASWLSAGGVQTKNALLRELSKNLSHDSGFWLMDLGGGWYEDPDLLDYVEKLNQINQLVREKEHQSAAEVLVLMDENSILRAGVSKHCLRSYCKDFVCNSKKAGVLVDVYRKSDVKKIDLSRYKIIVFAYTYELEQEELAYMKKANGKAAFLFQYAAGCIQNGKFSLENVYKTTGFHLEEKGLSEDPKQDFPMLSLCEEEGLVLKTEKGSAAQKTVEGRVHIFNTIPYLEVSQIKELYRLAGCHFHTPEHVVLYGDRRFITALSDGEQIDDFILLEQARKWKNAFTGESGQGDRIKLQLKPYEGAMFLLEE